MKSATRIGLLLGLALLLALATGASNDGIKIGVVDIDQALNSTGCDVIVTGIFTVNVAASLSKLPHSFETKHVYEPASSARTPMIVSSLVVAPLIRPGVSARSTPSLRH